MFKISTRQHIEESRPPNPKFLVNIEKKKKQTQTTKTGDPKNKTFHKTRHELESRETTPTDPKS